MLHTDIGMRWAHKTWEHDQASGRHLIKGSCRLDVFSGPAINFCEARTYCPVRPLAPDGTAGVIHMQDDGVTRTWR